MRWWQPAAGTVTGMAKGGGRIQNGRNPFLYGHTVHNAAFKVIGYKSCGELSPTLSGLETVESLSAKATADLSTNRNHLISITVKWEQFGCWAGGQFLSKYF